MTQDCPFCNLSERILKQNELAILLLSNPRKTPGHFLVVPKSHVEKPWELTSQELLAIFELINFAELKIVDKLATGCDVRQNYRPFMKQGRIKVDHVHYHVLPRSNLDRMYQISEKYDDKLFEDLSEQERQKIIKLLD